MIYFNDIDIQYGNDELQLHYCTFDKYNVVDFKKKCYMQIKF